MASQYPHGHAYDLFVSYSSHDLDWVRAFYDDLVKDISHFANVTCFLDQDRLQPSFLWNEALISAVSDSALLVPILSPQFLESDYCRKELNAFVEAHGLSSGCAYQSRIFPVKFLCSAPSDHALAQVQATPFFTERNGIPSEFGRETRRYKDNLRKLIVNIAQALKTVPFKHQPRAAVYLASDFGPRSDKLRDSLQHHFDVLPRDPKTLLTLSSEDLQQSLARDFGRSFVSVHPLSDAPGARELIKAQLDFARKQNKPRFLWTPDQRDDLSEDGFEWFTSQADLEDRIRRLHDKPPETKVSNAEPLIYFLCSDRDNKSRAEPLLDALEARGVHVFAQLPEGSADQALETHINALAALDGCLIYYGDVAPEWFNAVFPRVRKTIRQCSLRSAIFLAPPPTEHKTRDLRRFGMQIVQEPEAAVNFFLGAGLGATA